MKTTQPKIRVQTTNLVFVAFPPFLSMQNLVAFFLPSPTHLLSFLLSLVLFLCLSISSLATRFR